MRGPIPPILSPHIPTRRPAIDRLSTTSIANDVDTAARLISGAVHHTPLEPSIWLSQLSGADVSLKLECYQPTGSFKVRGALAAILHLTPEQRECGVITASAGNHGLGIAYAAARAGVHATVVVPENASSAKVHTLRRFPIELRFGGPNYDTAERTAIDLAASTGAHFISPYNHRWVIAGQGTTGKEIIEAGPSPDVLLVPVGGGGLISGIGSYLKTHHPETRIVGVQASNSPAMAEALRTGALVTIPLLPTLADGLAANIQHGSHTFDLASAVVDEMILITEDEMSAAIRASMDELHLALEASAVVGIAALLNHKLTAIEGKRIAVVVTGRNIATDRLLQLLAPANV
jgi:threonine dehydratase